MKIDRLVAMIMILLERDKISATELARIFEVSVRTIYRDLDSINQAGIPIVAISGPGNGVSILDTYKVEKRLFSTSDITSMLMALGSIQNSFPDREIVNTLAKVKGMVPLDQQQELEFRVNQIKIDVSPWFYAGSISTKIETIKVALTQQYPIRFDYRNINNQQSSREMEPYRLVYKSEDWYLQGYCLSREDFRTFKVLRMNNISVLEHVFTLRPFPADKMSHAQFYEKALLPAKLRIHEDILDLIISRFGEDCLTPEGSHHYIAQVHMPIDDLACRYLMNLGNKCECLEPATMRLKMYQLATELAEIYKIQ